MRIKKPYFILKETSSEIQSLLKNGFFKNSGCISDDLLEKLQFLANCNESLANAYGLLHLGKYICEGRVKNKDPLDGIQLFKQLAKIRNLDEDAKNLIVAAIEKAALTTNHHKAIEVLKESFLELGYKNIITALSNYLLLGTPPIQKNPNEWVITFYQFISSSLNEPLKLKFYLAHILLCASPSTYGVKEEVINILSNLFYSELWTQTHMSQLQEIMVKLYKKGHAMIKDINVELKILNEDAFAQLNPKQISC